MIHTLLMKDVDSGELVKVRMPTDAAMALVVSGVARFVNAGTQAEATRWLQTFRKIKSGEKISKEEARHVRLSLVRLY
jgi:hypothetical protein